MKNKLLLFISLLCICLTGCGKKDITTKIENQTDNIIETETEDSIIPDSIIQRLENVENSIFNMSKKDLLALSPAEIKEIIEKQLPDYRKIFIIDEDYEMTDSDWSNIRDIIVIDRYKSLNDQSNSSSNNIDTNLINKEEIEKMSIEEFKQYLPELYKQVFSNIMTEEELQAFIDNLNLDKKSDIEIEKIKNEFLNNI